jgi:thiosulfate dehydrogenase
MASGLSDADISAVATYLERSQPPFAAAPEAEPAQLEHGQSVVTLGRWAQGVPSCTSCHGAALQGVAPAIPSLTGQSSQYLSAQLLAYQNGQRAPGPLELMGRIARAMSSREIQDVALYIASLRAGSKPEIPRPATPEPYTAKPQPPDAFVPPPESAMPAGPYGDLVRLGQSIFEDTPKHATLYAGNTLSCRNCHLDRGRDALSSPMWAAYVHYPEYRKKDGLVNTIQMRIQGCFRYSQNGTVPEADSRELTALVTYFYWMAGGLPVGVKPKAAGYPKLDPPKATPSPERGAKVYATACALCHGDNGLGRSSGGQQVFPPLWGPQSFNWGAGMHQVDRAAGFIKTSMPYGAGGTLSDQEAWDVAAYVNSRPRPEDPRFTESVEKTRALYHGDHEHDYYGREVDGLLLGAPGTLEQWERRQQQR